MGKIGHRLEGEGLWQGFAQIGRDMRYRSTGAIHDTGEKWVAKPDLELVMQAIL